MKTTLKATNITLTPQLRAYVEEKIGSLERLFQGTDPDSVVVDIEVGKPSGHHQKGEVYRCEVNVAVGKNLLRAEERAESITEAVDRVRDEIQREVKKLHERRRSKFLRSAREFARRIKFFR